MSSQFLLVRNLSAACLGPLTQVSHEAVSSCELVLQSHLRVVGRCRGDLTWVLGALSSCAGCVWVYPQFLTLGAATVALVADWRAGVWEVEGSAFIL